MVILGNKHNRAKLLEVERKAKTEERERLDNYYQQEIADIRRNNLRMVEKIAKQYEIDRKEEITSLRKSLSNSKNQELLEQKNKYKKIISDKDGQILKLQEDIKELKRQLREADKKIQKSQAAYRSYREYVLQVLRYGALLSDEVKEIFSISGNLFQRFVTIRDKVESIDKVNTKYEKELLDSLSIEDTEFLLCAKTADSEKEIEYNESELSTK